MMRWLWLMISLSNLLFEIEGEKGIGMKEIEDLIKKAERFLKTAELTLNDGDYDSR